MRTMTLVIAAMSVIVIWAGSPSAADAESIGNGSYMNDTNMGSGQQVNANDWEHMDNVNAGGNQLTGGGINSNAGERWSDDVVINLGDYPLLASAALDVEVSGNTISAAGDGASANSTLTFSNNSGFTNNYGVTAVAVNSGPSASQSVSVNVMSDVSLGGATAGN